jgi:hypothetical protein
VLNTAAQSGLWKTVRGRGLLALLANLLGGAKGALLHAEELGALQRRQEGRELALLVDENLRAPLLKAEQLVELPSDRLLIGVLPAGDLRAQRATRFALLPHELLALAREPARDSLQPRRLLVRQAESPLHDGSEAVHRGTAWSAGAGSDRLRDHWGGAEDEREERDR